MPHPVPVSPMIPPARPRASTCKSSPCSGVQQATNPSWFASATVWATSGGKSVRVVYSSVLFIGRSLCVDY
ncbi:MAG: hypothetical protein ACOYN8_07705 [Pseudanabaena sp.]